MDTVRRNELIHAAKKKIEDELSRHGNWEQWYAELGEFRKQASPYLLRSIWERKMRPEYEDTIDHHILGYFAPLDLDGLSWRGERSVHYRHLIELNNDFRKSGIDFIYLALPCKKAIYPELVASRDVIPEDGIVIPQWRKMIYDLLDNDVLVCDLHPLFLQCKAENPDLLLYGPGHMWTCNAANIAAKELAKWLAGYAAGKEYGYTEDPCIVRSILNHEAVINRRRIFRKNEESASSAQDDVNNRIAIFGNCNLQMPYRNKKSYFASVLQMELGADVSDAGRILPYNSGHGESINNTLSCQRFRGKDVAVYVGFPSASYVRGRCWSKYRLPLFVDVDWAYLQNEFGISADLVSFAGNTADIALRALPDGAKVAFWGAGYFANYFMSASSPYRQIIDKINVVCIVDSFIDKHGTIIGGKYTVSHPKILETVNPDYIYTWSNSPSVIESIQRTADSYGIKVTPLFDSRYLDDREKFYQEWNDVIKEAYPSMSQFQLIGLIVSSLCLCDFHCLRDYIKAYRQYGYRRIKNIAQFAEYVDGLIG